MNWIVVLQFVYVAVLAIVVLRILFDTQTSTKTAAYILLVLLVPVVGMVIYLAFGLNYRKREMYNKKLVLDQAQADQILHFVQRYQKTYAEDFFTKNHRFSGTEKIIFNDHHSFVTHNNDVELLINGEEKFRKLLPALEKAKDHIHIQYYIYDNDTIGNTLAEILCRKAQEGVSVRMIFDDFGSGGIRRKFADRLREAGVEIYPFYKISHPIYFANRLNYRNHRKIVIIDGETAFVGGINVSDKYINQPKNKLYWRDTHLSIAGEGVWMLQRIFLADWNFCSKQNLAPTEAFFRKIAPKDEPVWVQIAASGPDSPFPTILYSYIHSIESARDEILLTTPYFVPGEGILTALKMAAMRNVKVKILVPGISDSWIVNAVSKSHYEELLGAGVEIYQYQKGFVHAKTMVCDRLLAVVGTANLDSRSFDLNFEVNAVVYEQAIAEQLREAFYTDVTHSEQLQLETWRQRPFFTRFAEKIVRLASPLV